ncbi:hypothetical protein DOQ73_23895 [Salmonella enterica subsp. enterica]|nr:hypothetical protein [Salmonella enterica subsp. enterica serovar Javiana]
MALQRGTEGWDGSKANLAKILGVAPKFVADGLGELTRAGLVFKRGSRIRDVGRPVSSYDVDAEILNDLRRHWKKCSRFLDGFFLAEAMSHEQSKNSWMQDIQPRVRALSGYNRLLLAALLSNANEFGLIRGLSKSDLGRITGFDGSSIRYRLRLLVKSHLVRLYAPGFASSLFPNGKVSSAYILDPDLLGLRVAWKLSLEGKIGDRVSIYVGNRIKIPLQARLGVWVMIHDYASQIMLRGPGLEGGDSSEYARDLVASDLKVHELEGNVRRSDFSALCSSMAEASERLVDAYKSYKFSENDGAFDKYIVLPYSERYVLWIDMSTIRNSKE